MEKTPRIAPPSPEIAARARERLAGLATPPGALGRVGELGAWLAAAQGEVPPRPLDDVRLVVLAGDHGVAAHGVSAYPPAVTEAMVRTIVAGRAGVSALAREHGVQVTVLDVAVDADLADLPAEVTARKVRRGSGAIHLTDALTRQEAEQSLALGASLARELVDDGAQLLMNGDHREVGGRRRGVERAERGDVRVAEAWVGRHEPAVVVGRPRPHPVLERRDRQLQDGVAGHAAKTGRWAASRRH
jgi:nicotinate-nucleotide--dimethylbenzimidazole phosphoribosyltransferase